MLDMKMNNKFLGYFYFQNILKKEKKTKNNNFLLFEI